MTFIAALKAIASIFSAAVSLFRDWLIFRAGRDQARADQAEGALHDIDKARKARLDARAGNAADGRLYDDDGFRRD